MLVLPLLVAPSYQTGQEGRPVLLDVDLVEPPDEIDQPHATLAPEQTVAGLERRPQAGG